MTKKSVLLFIFIILLFYPIYSIFQLEAITGVEGEPEEAQSGLINYQISIWISWIVMACMAVYTKWSRKSNLFFNLTYGFLIIAFAIFGYYTQLIITTYDLPSHFSDNYTHGVFAAVQNIVISIVLTGLLQVGVWWFTRRWHRRY